MSISPANTTINGITCAGRDMAAMKACCVGSGAIYLGGPIGNANSKLDASFCGYTKSEVESTKDFVACIQKAFNIPDRASLVKENFTELSAGKVNVSCKGDLPPSSAAVALAPSGKWAALALAAVLASSVVAL
ncbi:hypothetical protein Q8F55_007266 [Vanrija albida]|uniref:Hydrophobin n=1 Tax=Vanrija albida TaxID=181172 RepID=A0ABR3PZG3_9TREE